ncbi:MAG: 16S rRNA (adenine(1518)-N(6)/adenine(1519)-N(6))-dimethyltransferase RsmA [Vicinamibacteria bacterium]
MPRAIRAPARSGFRPSRSKGQNFLRDERYVQRIVRAIAPKPGETLIEIGSGEGQLTLPLAKAGARVIAIESDPRLVSELRDAASQLGELSSSVEIVERDAPSVNFQELVATRGIGPLRVCGNLPYSVAAPILLRLLGSADAFGELLLMFQQEVAERLTAKPGTKAYGFLSVIAQRAARLSVLFRIPPDAFRPRPRVVSALVRFELLHLGAREVGDEKLFRALVRGLLTHRRKTIGNNVKHMSPSGLSREALGIALGTLGIDPMRRAETLGVEEFAELSRLCASMR